MSPPHRQNAPGAINEPHEPDAAGKPRLSGNLTMSPSAPEVVRPAEPRLFTLRGQTVVLDSDLARSYGVSTKAFNQAIRRNAARFPGDFLFRLTTEEWAALRSQIVTLKPAGRGEHRKYRPLAFTEHGAIMAATLLNSPRAVAMSVYVVRAFVRMREELLGRADLEKRLVEIECTLIGHDEALRDLYQQIKPLLLPPEAKPKREIGFHVQDQTTAVEPDPGWPDRHLGTQDPIAIREQTSVNP